MSLFTGRLVEVGIGKETTRGTCATPTFWLKKTSFTHDDKVSTVKTEGSYGSIAESAITGQVVGRYAEGELEGEVNINSFGLLLLALFGDVSTTNNSPESGVHTHDFSLQNDNIHDSLTITVKDPDDSFRFCMAMIKSLDLDIALGEYVKYRAGFLSKYHQDIATPSTTYIVDHRFVHPDLEFKVASNLAGLSGASAISLKSLSLSIEKDVELVNVLGSLEPENIVNKTIRITGSLELNLEDKTWRDYMLNGVAKAMSIKLTSSKVIGSSSNPTLEMVFPKVWFEEWEPVRGLGDIATQTINFEVFYDLANLRLWSTMQLINTTSSY